MNFSRKKLSIIMLLSISVFLIFVSGCPSEKNDGEKIGVVVSILPQKQMVEKIGGDKVDVIVMVPPGASPHTYEPTMQQMAEVADAEVYFKVGSGVEFELTWMNKILESNPDLKVVDGSNGISLLEMEAHEHHEHDEEGHEHDDEAPHEEQEHEESTEEHNEHEHNIAGKDPHVWTSISNVKIMTENFYLKLVELDPENEEYHAQNKEAYFAELDSLDSEIRQTLSGADNKKFIVFHPAWGYFAQDYGLEQIAIEEAGKEPTAQNIAYLIEEAEEENIKVIFASPQFSTESAETLASEIGGSVVLINPLEEDILENLEKVSDAFKKSFQE